MSSQKQINANRQNATKSTGPKTPKGKAKSAQNAIKHGLTASRDVIKGESQEEFDAHKQSFLDALAPRNAVEDFLADRVASLAWRLKRANRLQNQFLIALQIDMPYIVEHRGILYQEPSNHDPNLTLAAALNRDFSREKIIQHLTLYERRIERSFFKCFNELKRQKRRETTDFTSGPDPVIPAKAGIQTRHCEQREAIPSVIPSTDPAKRTQSCGCENAATSMESELYNLCANAHRAKTKPNNNPPSTAQDAPRTTYRSTTRRY